MLVLPVTASLAAAGTAPRRNLRHRALHGELIDAIAFGVIGLEMGLPHAILGAADRRHHAVRTDGDDPVDILEVVGNVAELAASYGDDAFDDIADAEALVLRARRREADSSSHDQITTSAAPFDLST